MKTVPLSKLADIQYGFPFNSKCFTKEGKMRIVRIRDIKRPDQATYYTGEYDDAYVINNGDIIVGMDGEFNSTIWKHGPALLNQRIARIYPKQNVSKMYLYYLLKIKLKEEEQKITCSTVKHLLDSHLKNIQIPLLSMEEQEKLALVLEKTDDIRQKRELANQTANTLLQAVFTQMFGDPLINPKNWAVIELERLCDNSRIITYGIVQPGEHVNDGIPLVRPIDLTKTYVTSVGLKKVDRKIEAQYPRSRLKGMELLLSIRGTVGPVAIASSELAGANVSRGIGIIAPDHRTKVEYLFGLFKVNSFKQNIISKSKGIALKQFNLNELRILKVPSPPIELQEKFASILQLIESITLKQEQSKQEIEILFNSLMSKIFKGEFV